ncbi:hypothetical protein D3C77_408400 [compost metagenome]
MHEERAFDESQMEINDHGPNDYRFLHDPARDCLLNQLLLIPVFLGRSSEKIDELFTGIGDSDE